MDPDQTAPLGWSRFIVFAFMIKSSLKCRSICSRHEKQTTFLGQKKNWPDKVKWIKLHSPGLWFVCLIWFFTSHQQSFSYIGTGLPGLNQYEARINVSSSKTTTQWHRWGSNLRPFDLESSTLPLSHFASSWTVNWKYADCIDQVISLMCFGCSEELSHRDDSFEYP